MTCVVLGFDCGIDFNSKRYNSSVHNFHPLIAAVKIILKALHQIITVAVNRNFLNLRVGVIRSNWPDGAKLRREEDFVGLSLARIEVPIDKLMVTNDFGNSKKQGRQKAPKYIPLKASLRLQVFLDYLESGNSPVDKDIPNTKISEALLRMENCLELEKAEISVLQQLNGKVLVVDGTHRLVALYSRDRNLTNIDFLLTV